MPPIRNMNNLTNGTIAQTRPSIILIHPTSTLRRLYARTPLARAIHVPLVQFPPLSGPCTNLLEHPDVNDPDFIDFDAACSMMLTRDLLALFGIMAHPANRKVPMKNLSKFNDRLHMISDPIVVKVYIGDDEHQRISFKDDLKFRD
jgi:hypothetical protein